MKKSKILYIDLDDTVADFYKATKCPDTYQVLEHRMWNKNFFLHLDPIPGAQGALFDLEKMGFNVWFLSQPLAENPESYTDKAKWIQLHFPKLYKKIILTQDKGLLLGHYLIDDNKEKWGQKFEQNGGKFVHYPYDHTHRETVTDKDHLEAWRSIIEFFKKENPYLD